MFRLPRKIPQTPEEKGNVDDNIPTYCILGQNTDTIFATEKLRPSMATVATSKEIMKPQKNNVYCQSIAQLIGINALLLSTTKSYYAGKLHRWSPSSF